MAGAARESGKPLRVRLIVDAGNSNWILGKFADRLAAHLPGAGIDCEIGGSPSASVDINHWMFYGHAWGYFFQQKRAKATPATVSITHMDDPIKVRMLREVMDQVADIGICMSAMTLETLAAEGFARERLCYILPGHDGGLVPRRTTIGITSRAYPDGRKRQNILVDLARSMRLDTFHFEIAGAGWEPLVPHLEEAGASVNYFAGTSDYIADYERTLAMVRTCDFYLYLGMDEGSMGLLDALALGIETIVTPQGFHLDIEGGITHGFTTGKELASIFSKLADRKQRLVDSVRPLTWSAYADQHALVWRALAEEDVCSLLSTLHPNAARDPQIARKGWAERARFYLAAGRSDYRGLYWQRRKWELRATLSRVKRRLLKSPPHS